MLEIHLFSGMELLDKLRVNGHTYSFNANLMQLY